MRGGGWGGGRWGGWGWWGEDDLCLWTTGRLKKWGISKIFVRREKKTFSFNAVVRKDKKCMKFWNFQFYKSKTTYDKVSAGVMNSLPKCWQNSVSKMVTPNIFIMEEQWLTSKIIALWQIWSWQLPNIGGWEDMVSKKPHFRMFFS